jgi:glucan-binding YG repeat protein
VSRNFKKISVASALVAATTLPTTMVSALETNVKNDSNTPVTLSSERRGWYEEYGYKYYYDDNGELLKGLQEIDGNTYYFYSYDGHMAYSSWYDEDTITDNGLIVTVNKSGIVTNYANIVVGDWTHYGDKWYYYDADMNPYIGVKTINGVEYYFNYGQLAEYLDKVVTSGDTLAYVRDGKVIEKAKFKDNELIYLNGNCYYYYLNDAGYYYPYDGEYTVDGKSLYFIYGMLQTSDSDEILTDYRNDYLYAYNNKGEIVDKVKRVAGWNEIGNDWYYVSSEMNFVDGIYTVNGKEYYFENGRLIKSSNGISVVSSYRDENDKIVTYVIAYNSEGVVVEKKKAVANTWIQLRGKWYYYDKNLNEADGKMTTGWLEENDSWYYLDKDGQKNNWLVNIKW